MNAVVLRFVSAGVRKAREIVADNTLTVHEKISDIILAQKPEQGGKQEIIEKIHQGDNAAMHQRSMREILLQITPVLTETVEQGVRQKVFSTPYPRKTIEFLLASALLLFDDGLFSWDGETMLQKATAFIYTMETILGAEKGSFACLKTRKSERILYTELLI